MGGFWYGGAIKPCPGDGCTNKISYSEPLCPECQRQQAAEELAISMQGKREVERLEQLLKFEAWCTEHENQRKGMV